MIAIVLKTMPPSTNHLYTHSRRGTFIKPAVRDAKEAIAWEARSQYRGKPLPGPLSVSVKLYWPDKRNRDIDNIKGLLDALTGVVWQDDGVITALMIRKDYDKANPRVEMEVFELG